MEPPDNVPRLAPISRWVRGGIWALVVVGAVIFNVVGYNSYQFTSGEAMPAFPDSLSRIEDIRALAAGQDVGSAPPGTLCRAILKNSKPMTFCQPGDTKLFVGFGEGPTTRNTFSSWGFPTPSVRFHSYAAYADAVTRTGFLPSVTDPSKPQLGRWEMPQGLPNAPPRKVWSWDDRTLIYQPPPEETGGVVETWHVLATPLALQVATVGIVTVAIAALWRRVRGRSRRGGRAARVIGSFVIALALIVGLSFGVTRDQDEVGSPSWANMIQVGLPPQPVYWMHDGFVELPLTRAGVMELQDRPDADRVLARAILDAVPLEDQKEHLAVWPVREAWIPPVPATPRKNLWVIPLGNLSCYAFERHPLFGTPERIAATPGWSVDVGLGGIEVGRAVDSELWLLRVSTASVPALIVGIVLAGWLLITAIRFMRGVGIRRRFVRRCCVRCGYSLA